MKVGKKIARLRELKGLSQDNLALALKMSQSGYAKIERDEVSINLDKLEHIATILEINLFDILGFDEKLIFNNTPTRQKTNAFFYIKNKVSEKERELYESQIQVLKDELIYFKTIIDKLVSKNIP
jgi:transcriptional regulator with XRE-family HTH domain